MMYRRIAAVSAAFLFFVSLAFAQQIAPQTTPAATVSEKQDIAVFALGYYGYNIPLETLATVDAQIQGVFVNLGRFNVFGATERFAAKDVQTFIDTLKKMKETNTPLPEELKFGDVQMTSELYNKLFGAFVVVIPTVTDFNSQYNKAKNQFETTLKTSVAFINVANGSTFGFANINTSGTSKETQYKSIKLAMDGLAPQLTFEIRKISAFTLNTKVLQVKGGEVKMQLGRDMGVQVGDEYAVIEKTQIAGLSDDREDGLILIKNVGAQISTGTVLYSGSTLGEGAQLREIPRLGFDLMPYLRYMSYFQPVNGSNGALLIGAKAVASRFFYNIRPFAGIQASFDSKLFFPIAAYAGVEYDIILGRLTLNASGAIGGASNVLIKVLESNLDTQTDDAFFSHYGAIVNVGASFLITRDLKLFAEVGAEYWIGILNSLGGPWSSYGGPGVSVGAAIKF
ncbi:MAG: hypothetical protein WCT14_17710 [Treponemataceae bacterium]